MNLVARELIQGGTAVVTVRCRQDGRHGQTNVQTRKAQLFYTCGISVHLLRLVGCRGSDREVLWMEHVPMTDTGSPFLHLK